MYTDRGCNYHQTISSNGDNSRFRIQLSPANSCHCVTIDSVSGPYGPSMLDEWSDLWYNQQNLCASDQPKNFISKSFDFKMHNRIQATGTTDPAENGCLGGISFPPPIMNNTVCTSILQSFCLTSNSTSTTASVFSSTATSVFSSTPSLTKFFITPIESSSITQYADYSSTIFIPSSTAVSPAVSSTTDQTDSTAVSIAVNYSTIIPSHSSTVPILNDYSSTVQLESMNPSTEVSVTAVNSSATFPSPSLTVPNYYSSTVQMEPTSLSIEVSVTDVSANNMIPSLSSTVSTSYSSSDISPTPLFCPTEGIWNQTLACNSTRIPTSLRARCLNNRLANGFGK